MVQAKHGRGIDWSPHIGAIFDHVLTAFNLPVGKNGRTPNRTWSAMYVGRTHRGGRPFHNLNLIARPHNRVDHNRATAEVEGRVWGAH